MTDRNTHKLILTACLLFGGWMLIHFDAMEGLNNLTNGVFYQTTAEIERRQQEAWDRAESNENVSRYRQDLDLFVSGLITIDEVHRREEKRKDDHRMERLLRERRP